MITIFPYDGSAASVDRIMDVVGTKGVCNFNNLETKGLQLPSGGYLFKGDAIHTDGKKWWAVSRISKYPVVSPKGRAK